MRSVRSGRNWGGRERGHTCCGNEYTGNKDGINIFGDSSNITIAENNLSGNSRYGINLKAADVLIELNQLLNNADSGINLGRGIARCRRQ